MNFKGHNDVSLIVAVDEDGGYAKDGKIPWSYEDDWIYFRRLTKNSVCVMGRGTYEDIVSRQKEVKDSILPNRDVYVVSSSLANSVPRGTKGAFSSVRKVYETLKLPKNNKREIFILGGRQLYLQHVLCAKQVYLTLVPGRHQCNHFFPVEYLSKHYKIVHGKEKNDLRFITYARAQIYYDIYPLNPQMFADMFKQYKRKGTFVSRNNSTHCIRVNYLSRREQKFLQDQGVKINKIREFGVKK